MKKSELVKLIKEEFKKLNERKFYGFELSGHEATEENARNAANGLDWSEITVDDASYPHLNFVDEVNGVDIWYNYASDSYYFSDADDSIEEGLITEKVEDYRTQIDDLIRNYKKKIKDLSGLELDAKIVYDVFAKNMSDIPSMKLEVDERGLAFFKVVVKNDKTAMAVYEKLKGLMRNSKINKIAADQYMTMFLTVRDKSE